MCERGIKGPFHHTINQPLTLITQGAGPQAPMSLVKHFISCRSELSFKAETKPRLSPGQISEYQLNLARQIFMFSKKQLIYCQIVDNFWEILDISERDFGDFIFIIFFYIFQVFKLAALQSCGV